MNFIEQKLHKLQHPRKLTATCMIKSISQVIMNATI